MPLGDGEAALQLKNDVPTQLCEDSVGFPPDPLLCVFWSTKKQEGERCSLLPAASKLWLESARCAKYHSCILQSMTCMATEELGSMMLSPVHTAGFFCFFSHGHELKSYFFSFFFAEPRCWVQLQHNSRQADGVLTKFYLFMYVFIHCRLIPFFCLPNFQGLLMNRW